MNIIKEAFQLARWSLRVVRVFARIRPFTTVTLIVLSVISRITNVLAFFLPLKVILLAGSDGVPRYFRFFIAPDEKADWIIWLSAAAVLSYLLTFILDAVSERLAEASSMDVLQGANEMALVGKERKAARSYYHRFAQVMADSAFGIATLVAIGFVNPILLGVLLSLYLVQYLFSALVLAVGDPLHPNRVQTLIRDNRKDFLQGLSSINFLIGFFVILTPFLLGMQGNILLAILSVLLMRRGFGAQVAAIDDVIDLYSDRHRIDPLVFKKRQLERQENEVNRAMRAMFSKKRRLKVAEKKLEAALGNVTNVEANWQDSPIKGAYTFHLSCTETSGGEAERVRSFQQQVFPPKQVHLLSGEEFLFSKVGREMLKAPAVVARFEEGQFECQICDYGDATPLRGKAWQEAYPMLIAHMWSIRPPKDLVRAFNNARPMLFRRLTDELVERLAVAVDTKEEAAALKSLQRELPAIRERLEAVPTYIYNPDINPGNCVTGEDGSVQVMTWVRWAIEPMGVGVLRGIKDSLESMAETVNKERKGLKSPVKVDDLVFVNRCWHMERSILRGDYKAALGVAMAKLDLPDLA